MMWHNNKNKGKSLFGGTLHSHMATTDGVVRFSRKIINNNIVETLSIEEECQLYECLNFDYSPKIVSSTDTSFTMEFIKGEALSVKDIGINCNLQNLVQLLSDIHKCKIPNILKSLRTDFDTVKRLQKYKQILTDNNMLYPVISNAIDWLIDNSKQHDGVLVHGDYKLDNIFIKNKSITGVLDWEFAHIGSRVEDLGWLTSPLWLEYDVKLWSRCKNDTANIILSYYNKVSGTKIKNKELHYWTVFSYIKFACIASQQYMRSEALKDIDLHMTGWRLWQIENNLSQLLNNINKPLNLNEYIHYKFPEKKEFLSLLIPHFILVISGEKSLKNFIKYIKLGFVKYYNTL